MQHQCTDALARYTDAVMNNHPQAGTLEHRDYLVGKLCEMTGLTRETPIPPACRKNPMVFFGVMEDWRKKLEQREKGAVAVGAARRKPDAAKVAVRSAETAAPDVGAAEVAGEPAAVAGKSSLPALMDTPIQDELRRICVKAPRCCTLVRNTMWERFRSKF